MKLTIIIIIFLISFYSVAIDFSIKGKVISSSCKIDIDSKYENKDFKDMQYILVFDLIESQAYISVTNGMDKNIPHASLRFGNDSLDYAYFESNGGVELNARYRDIWKYLSSLDLKYFNSYNEAVKFSRNSLKCKIQYSNLKRYYNQLEIAKY